MTSSNDIINSSNDIRSIHLMTSDYIVDQNIDVCVVTETWLKDMDTTSIAGVCLPGYSFKSFPRQSNRSGGGTGVMFNTNLYVSLSGGTHSLYHQNCKFILAGGSCPRSLENCSAETKSEKV